MFDSTHLRQSGRPSSLLLVQANSNEQLVVIIWASSSPKALIGPLAAHSPVRTERVLGADAGGAASPTMAGRHGCLPLGSRRSR